MSKNYRMHAVSNNTQVVAVLQLSTMHAAELCISACTKEHCMLGLYAWTVMYAQDSSVQAQNDTESHRCLYKQVMYLNIK